MTPRRVAALACVLAPAWLLAYAGALKLADPAALVGALRTYQLFPYGVMAGVALAVPWLEIAAGVAVLFPRWRAAGAALAALLLAGFLAGIVQAWARGLDLSCGCLGSGAVATTAADYTWLVGRNTLLLVALGAWWRLDGRAAGGQNGRRR